MRHEALILAALLMLVGGAGASARPQVAGDAEGSAAPTPDLAGTWSGLAWAVPGSLYFTTAPVELTIRPDGTWIRTRRGEPQANGRLRIRGDRVFLDEESSKDVEQRVELWRSGNRLLGLTEAFIPGAISAVDLERVS